MLTLLGSAMLLTDLLEKPLRRIPPAAGFAISAVLFALTRNVSAGYLGFGSLRLWLPQALYANCVTAYFGFYPWWFYSTDYFALLPWLFLFWAGYFRLRLFFIKSLTEPGNCGTLFVVRKY